jgi:hypothetical protein
MTDQLLGWLVWMGVVLLPAATLFFNRLSVCLEALNRAVVSLTGVVVSLRAFWMAVRPPRSESTSRGLATAKKTRRSRTRRLRSNNRT